MMPLPSWPIYVPSLAPHRFLLLYHHQVRFQFQSFVVVYFLLFNFLYLWYFLLRIVKCLDGQGRREEILGEELPALAKEVARVETVRVYAGQFCFYYWNKWVNVAVKYSKILLLDWFILVVHTRLKYFVYVSQNGGFMFCCFLMIPWIGFMYFSCTIGGWVVFCGNSTLHSTLSSLPNMGMDFVGYSQFPTWFCEFKGELVPLSSNDQSSSPFLMLIATSKSVSTSCFLVIFFCFLVSLLILWHGGGSFECWMWDVSVHVHELTIIWIYQGHLSLHVLCFLPFAHLPFIVVILNCL